METPIYIALSRQTALERQMDIVANNLANATTPGFKAENSLFAQTLLKAEQPRRLAYVQDAGSYRDFSAGALQATGNDLDLALAGKGFFTIQTSAGIRYTRDGRFTLNEQGQIVTANNEPVLAGGAPVTIDAADGQVQIAKDGTISTDRARNGQFLNVLGKLDIVRFTHPQQLEAEGDNLYSAPAQAGITPDDDPSIAQRMLEGSNVKSIVELTGLMAVSRSYQATQHFIDSEHDRQRKAISTLVGT